MHQIHFGATNEATAPFNSLVDSLILQMIQIDAFNALFHCQFNQCIN